MGGSLAWTKGSLGLFPAGRSSVNKWDWTSVKDRSEGGERRRLQVGAEAEEEEKWVSALSTLIDTFATLGCALAAVLLLQLLVHLLWKHRLNRRYYALREQMKQRKSNKDRAAPEAAAPAAAAAAPPPARSPRW